MARVLKTRIESNFEDAAFGVGEPLSCAFYSLQQHIPVRSLTRAPSEQLGKIVRAHADHRGKFRQAEICCQIVSNIVKHTPEPIRLQASSVSYRSEVAHGVTLEQVDSQRVGQAFAV